MSTWIALLRGIGGGIRPLPMKVLVGVLEAGGLGSVRTYIQSGNVVLTASRATAPQLAKRIGGLIERGCGFRPWVMVLTTAELERAIDHNPFREAEAEPKSLHLFFMAVRPAAADIEGMNKLRSPSERFAIKGNILYLHTPKGFGISKLAARIDRLLHVDTTARNWRTVGKVLEMAKAGD